MESRATYTTNPEKRPPTHLSKIICQTFWLNPNEDEAKIKPNSDITSTGLRPYRSPALPQGTMVNICTNEKSDSYAVSGAQLASMATNNQSAVESHIFLPDLAGVEYHLVDERDDAEERNRVDHSTARQQNHLRFVVRSRRPLLTTSLVVCRLRPIRRPSGRPRGFRQQRRVLARTIESFYAATYSVAVWRVRHGRLDDVSIHLQRRVTSRRLLRIACP